MSALAGTDRVTAYVDAYGLGTWNIDQSFDDDDDGSLNGVIVGLDIPIRKFKLGFEYEDSSLRKGDFTDLGDYTTYIIKCGFRVFGNDRVRVDLTLNSFEEEFTDSKATVSGTLVGADGLWNISDRMFLQISLGLSLNGEYQDDSVDENAIIMVEKVKFNYMFTDNFGLGFGFRYNSIVIDYNYEDVIVDTAGLTIGATVRF